MAKSYEEILEGEIYLRNAPGLRHEKICAFLHVQVAASITEIPSSRLLAPRSVIQLSPGTLVRPDLALVAAANNRLWLAAEIINSDDHRFDTVRKKSLYEETNVPRLWMIDPRYDNIEVYHGTEFGLVLKGILAGREVLTEKLLPEFQLVVADLFKPY